jgi:DNA-binding NarL/FixJ family response regulator
MNRLIVVADNSLIVEAIRSGLRSSGTFQLLGYSHARNASARVIADAAADAVLVDEADRDQQTLTLIREIKEVSSCVTVIVLTVSIEGEWLQHALDAGASGAISKAVHPTALATLVRECLSGHIVHSLAGVNTKDAAPNVTPSEACALTERELEVLQLVAAGATNGEIARKLWITQQTVKFHVSNIYRKLDVANRTEACHYAHVNGLIVPAEAEGLRLAVS